MATKLHSTFEGVKHLTPFFERLESSFVGECGCDYVPHDECISPVHVMMFHFVSILHRLILGNNLILHHNLLLLHVHDETQ